MSGHTPGPWDWYWRESDGEADCGVYWEKYQGQAYSVCRAPRYQTEEQWAADARLIAAAPELLEALIDARKQLEAYEEALNGEDYNSPRINAAIAKATGEQP